MAARPLRAAVGVIGELLITAGVLVLLFVAWELWWTNLEADATQDDAASTWVQQFEVPAEPGERTDRSPEQQAADDLAEFGEPPASAGGEGTFGVLYVPRFADDYARPVSEGVGLDVLNTLGIGHYPDTQLPGEPGNFALAGHRQTHGQVFYNIDQLTDGDRLYVQTAEGFYQYRYRSTEIVTPYTVEVLAPVPHQPDAEPTESVLTLTSCHPLYTTRERIIAYAVLESFRPADAGPQDAIRDAHRAAAE
ncbi:class E sortase [Zhihengliuella somnathii]